jgi:hypothetical protein
LHPLLHLFGIILSVLRTRRQAGKPQAMEQTIDTGQRIRDSEFLFQDSLGLFASQRADAVGLGGLGQETCFEGCFLRHW